MNVENRSIIYIIIYVKEKIQFHKISLSWHEINAELHSEIIYETNVSITVMVKVKHVHYVSKYVTIQGGI